MNVDAALEQRKAQLAAEVGHWRAAAGALADLEAVAAPEAWARVEQYVDQSLRTRLRALAADVDHEARRLVDAVPAAGSDADLAVLRRRALGLRRRYLRAETIVDFFGDAVNTRTNTAQGELLRGLDLLAADSMRVVLRPLGLDAAPVVTYIDKGLGASILRAGVRLWDAGSESPVAMIKITRHNLLHPTSLLHETGHQVFHQARWVPELADALHRCVRPASAFAADAWRSWASEIAADVHAFVLAGYGPVPALANVVDGPTARVFAMPLGDPHPFGWIRVLFNTALCRSWYGAGPWDRLEDAWLQRHRPASAHSDVVALVGASLPLLDRLVDVCTREPMHAFGGRPLAALTDPRRVAPTVLRAFAERAGAALYTSAHLQREEPLRILAWTTLRLAGSDPTAARDLSSWLRRLGHDPAIAATTTTTSSSSQSSDQIKETRWTSRHRAA